jgi:hypothetical protein
MITRKLRMQWMRLADYLWAIGAYLRGKVLATPGYAPRSSDEATRSPLVYFHLPVVVGIRRMNILRRMWGLRPATAHELQDRLRSARPLPDARWGDKLQQHIFSR